MRSSIKVALATLLVCGALLIVLGIIIWTGHGDQLIPVHVAIGVVLVLTLWTIAAIAARSRVPAGTVAFAAAWGLLVVFFGLAQEDLLTGSWHWTIQALHLVISMGAIWWGRRLVKLMAEARSTGGPTPAHPPWRRRRVPEDREHAEGGRSHAEREGGRIRVPGQQAGCGHGRVPHTQDPREQQRVQAAA